MIAFISRQSCSYSSLELAVSPSQSHGRVSDGEQLFLIMVGEEGLLKKRTPLACN